MTHGAFGCIESRGTKNCAKRCGCHRRRCRPPPPAHLDKGVMAAVDVGENAVFVLKAAKRRLLGRSGAVGAQAAEGQAGQLSAPATVLLGNTVFRDIAKHALTRWTAAGSAGPCAPPAAPWCAAGCGLYFITLQS